MMNELHVIANFAAITVHEELVDLVVEVLLAEFQNFTEFSYTSSGAISLDFMFLNFRLTFGENLLFLSAQ